MPSSRLITLGSWTKPEISPVMGSGSGNARLKIGDAVARDVKSRPWMASEKAIVADLL